ncbi:MAG: DUF2911 domain-containing protein [Acidobacteriaceae bacterium]
MKRFLMCVGLLALTATTVPAQQKAPLSPPEKATASVEGKTITILYSSPRVKGREGKIFTKDGLISHNPHYPVWRAGANSATTLETDADLTIGDLSVPKGKYTLFVDISDPDHWTLIVNKQTGEWGLAYNASYDLGKTKMEMSKPPHMIEDLEWTIDLNGGKGTITLAWEDHSASVPVEVH